jgi:Tfp pilus assembly protein PilO
MTLAQRIAHLQQRQRKLAIGTVIVLALGAAGVYWPTSMAIANANAQKLEQVAALEQVSLEAQQLERTRRQVVELSRRLESLKQVSPDNQQSDYIRELGDLVAQAGLNAYGSKPNPTAGKSGDRFTEQCRDLSFEGSFDETFRFLQSIDGSTRLLRVERMRMVGDAEKNGRVQTELTLGYFTTPAAGESR